MDVRFISPAGVELRDASELPDLLALTLAVMLAMSATLLIWAKRKGWF